MYNLYIHAPLKTFNNPTVLFCSENISMFKLPVLNTLQPVLHSCIITSDNINIITRDNIDINIVTREKYRILYLSLVTSTEFKMYSDLQISINITVFYSVLTLSTLQTPFFNYCAPFISFGHLF